VERLSEEGAVLLKNDGAALPLQGAALGSVAVIGPTARQTMVEGNRQERARVFPERDVINPLQVLQALAPSGSHFPRISLSNPMGQHCD
jgi:beta-glucosidase